MNEEGRLEALEFKLAHLERGLQELSDVVVRQQQDLDRLAQRNQQLTRHLAALQEQAGEPGDPNEIPPHY